MPVSPDAALRLAGATGRLRVFDFSFNLHDTYTFWSGMIGGTFLMLSYFGTDQSQVQRYLSAKSVDEARSAHLISAYWKIPLQGLVLLVGVLVFVFYLFFAPPLYFNPAQERLVQSADPVAYRAARGALPLAARRRRRRNALPARSVRRRGADDAAARARCAPRDSAVARVHDDALALAEKVSGAPSKDVNYIIPHFVLTELPIGLTGLFIAAVIAAAMSAVAGELSALSTATVIDHYRRWIRPDAGDAHLLVRVARGHRRVGALRVRRRDVRGDARIAHRGGEPVRLDLLRLDPRRVHPRDAAAHPGERGVRRADRRDGRRGVGHRVRAAGLVSLAQRGRRGHGGGGRAPC